MGWETAEGRITFWGKDCDIEGGGGGGGGVPPRMGAPMYSIEGRSVANGWRRS